VKIQKLQAVAPLAPKRKDSTSRRLLAQHILRKSSQSFDPLTHVRDTAGEINPNTGSRANHAASIARIRRFSATASTSPLKRRLRPQRECNSIIAGKPCMPSSARRSLSGGGGKSSGRNTVFDGGDNSPFSRNSRRQV